MALKVITTVGTSIFSNYQKKEIAERLDNKYQSINDLVDRLVDLPASEYNTSRWKSPIRNIKERIEIIWLPFAQEEATKASKFTKASAEIETLYKIAKDEQQNLDVYLLATDTVLSVIACELIKEWFDKDPSVKDTNFKIKCHFYGDINAPDTTIIEGLQVKDADRFETEGFNNLLNIIEKYSEKGKTILNISGGYKAVIPFLTLFAQLKEIPLKYTYEDSEQLITVGNLPFSLDWAVVEALKPFLNPYFLVKDEIQILGSYWREQKIKFDDNNKRFIGTDDVLKKEVKELKIKDAFHQLFNTLINYQLVIWNKEKGQIQVSALGELIAKFQFSIETNKGHIIEHLLFKYFAIGEKKNVTLGYVANLSIPNVPETYQLDNRKVKLGDVDVWLRYEDKYNVWAEAKAFSAAQGYAAEEAGNKYYTQLKSRILALNQPYLETLFIVFRFVFKDINEEVDFVNEPLKTALAHLQKLNTDPDLVGKSKFRCLGISIPANFKGNRIDLTESFYKGDFNKWTWEEITV